MTVQQLINELQQINDKSLEVKKDDHHYWDWFPVNHVKIQIEDSDIKNPKQVVLLMESI